MTNFYMTHPSDDELPATVPAGTKWRSFLDDSVHTLLSEGKLGPTDSDSAVGGLAYKAAVHFRGREQEGNIPAKLICWETVPRQPAPWQPEPGQPCTGLGLGTHGPGYKRSGKFESFTEDGGEARLRRDDGGDGVWFVTRESLRPIPQVDTLIGSSCGDGAVEEITVGGGFEFTGAYSRETLCHCGQPSRYSGQCADCRQDTERGTLGLPALSEAGALQARRLESAKGVMGAVLVRRKRVEWIQPGQPASWPSADENEP